MAAKAFSDQGRPLPANVRLGGMTLSGIGLDDDCVVFIAPRNSVGDPVVLQVEEIVDCLSETGATFILVNPDLGEKVALGIIERDRRQNFLNSFEAAYFFRNIVTMQRPQLIPMERGALVKQWGQPWRVYVSDVPLGSGSLNRFMNMNVYLQSPEDPTVDNPPPFICAGEFDKAPSREEMSFCVEAAPRLAAEAKAEADGEAAARAEIEAKSVKDVVEAREVLTAVVAGAGDTSKVISAALSLEKNARSCRKARETALAETSLQPVFESLTRGEGYWQLCLTMQDGRSGRSKGKKESVTRVPVKAVIQFKSDLSTTNGIYFGSWPLVQFFGQMSWNEVAMRVTFGYDEMKLFGGAINIPVNIPLTPKEGFNLSSVEERWVLGRGTSGGMAVWERVANP
ncbi:unnamed protein product [Chrysoparadoxa australica]